MIFCFQVTAILRFLVNEALPLATCLLHIVRLIFGILKQIQIRLLIEFKQIIF